MSHNSSALWIRIGVCLQAYRKGRRTNPASAAGFTLAILSLSLLPALAQKPSSPNTNSELPAGPMQAKATAACLECHDARIILQQRLSKAAWTKEIEKMIKWGALVDPGDRDPLIDYFGANFAVEAQPYQPPRTAISSPGNKR